MFIARHAIHNDLLPLVPWHPPTRNYFYSWETTGDEQWVLSGGASLDNETVSLHGYLTCKVNRESGCTLVQNSTDQNVAQLVQRIVFIIETRQEKTSFCTFWWNKNSRRKSRMYFKVDFQGPLSHLLMKETSQCPKLKPFWDLIYISGILITSFPKKSYPFFWGG